MRLVAIYLSALACICLLIGAGWAAEEMRTVVDSRGVEVQIPTDIERVVTISEGLVEDMMFILGEEEKIVGIGSSCLQMTYNWTIPAVSGDTYEYGGAMSPVAYLNPRVLDLPSVKESASGTNYETLAGLDPDLVIFRVYSSMEDEGVQKEIQTIEALGIPVVVLEGPPCFDEPNVSTISDEIKIIGAVFGMEEKAVELADYLESQTQIVFERTKDISESEKPTVIVFGASPTARQAGGAGVVRGTDTIESYFIETIVHAKNAFKDTGSPTISAEQLLALDPEVIVLTALRAYHPPEEIYSAPYYQNVGELRAVKNHRIMSLPFVCRLTRCLDYPIDVMVIAKAVYPDRFADIDLSEWLLEFYQNVYGVDRATAEGLRSAQLMDWCVEGWTPTRGSNSGGDASYRRAS